MHPNPAFRATERADNIAFARSRAFGTLAVNSGDGPLLSHVPFLIDDAAKTVDLHLVRSNPIARLAGPTEAVIAVQGADGYISPDWYGVANQVPTWNYVAVHLRGCLEPLPDDKMRDMLDRQSAAYEGLLPKPPWTTAKMSPDVLDRMMRQIRPFRLTLSDVQGTWKLGQNKPDVARLSAADALATSPFSMESDRLAQLMRDAGER